MKKFIYAMSALFIVSITVVLGLRMSPDAMAVIIGIVCGMMASIPTTILLVYVLRQRDQQQQQLYQQQYQGQQYPPVVVVNGHPNQQHYPHVPSTSGSGYLPAPGNGRSFKVVGQDADPVETFGETFSINSIWDEGK